MKDEGIWSKATGLTHTVTSSGPTVPSRDAVLRSVLDTFFARGSRKTLELTGRLSWHFEYRTIGRGSREPTKGWESAGF